MDRKHTKEPWAVHPTKALIVPLSHIDRPIGAHVNKEIDLKTYAQEICAMHWPDRNRSEQEVKANAKRIVACVNACVGVPTEKLESDYQQGYEPWAHVEHLEKRIAELEALKADAERYRWLREQNADLEHDTFVVLTHDDAVEEPWQKLWAGADLDEAIDQAMNQPPKD
jgi:hypothetical protein